MCDLSRKGGRWRCVMWQGGVFGRAAQMLPDLAEMRESHASGSRSTDSESDCLSVSTLTYHASTLNPADPRQRTLTSSARFAQVRSTLEAHRVALDFMCDVQCWYRGCFRAGLIEASGPAWKRLGRYGNSTSLTARGKLIVFPFRCTTVSVEAPRNH